MYININENMNNLENIFSRPIMKYRENRMGNYIYINNIIFYSVFLKQLSYFCFSFNNLGGYIFSISSELNVIKKKKNIYLGT